MKTLKPLAAALLLVASSAYAQFGPQPAGGGFSMTSGNGGNSNPLSFANMTGSGPIPDASFSCSSMDNAHIPYAPCNETQLADRKRFNGECPPKSTACKEYLQRSLSGANPAGTIAAYNPPPGRSWKSPSCTHIPCALEDEPTTVDEIVVTAPRREPAATAQPGDDGFIGPPLPPGWGDNRQIGATSAGRTAGSNAPAPAPTEADFNRAFEEAQATYGENAIDLGNKTYGILDEKGDGMSVCGPSGCSRGNQADHKDKIQQARAESFAFNNNGGTQAPGGNGNNKASAQTSGGATGDDDSGSTGGATGLGRGFAADQANISGTGGGDSSTGDSAGGAAADNGKGYIAVKPSEMQPVGSIQITHTALLKTEADINAAQRTFNSGQNGFATPNDDTGSAAGDPPISPEHLGKIQAVENGPASK